MMKQEEPRLSLWKSRLLDLSLRNPLLHFRPRSSSLPLQHRDLPRLEDRLSHQRWHRLEGEVELKRASGSEKQLRVALLPEELGRRLRRLYQRAREDLQESGTRTLFLTLGMLEWIPAGRGEPVRAPLLLLPGELQPLKGGRFRFRVADEEPRFNAALAEKLKLEGVWESDRAIELLTDDQGLDVEGIWEQVMQGLPASWRLQPEAWITRLAFHRHILWADLEERSEALMRSPVVRLILREQERLPAPAPVEPGEGPLVLPADASQRRALQRAREGHCMVLQGPPGTGKSQTITNLIAQALERGQTVLFVAEKAAALEVVSERLERVGLGPFCLPLHSHRARRREVTLALGEALSVEAESWAERAELQQRLRSLEGQLGGHRDALHEPGPFGWSPYQVMQRWSDCERALARPLSPSITDASAWVRMQEVALGLGEAAALSGRPRDSAWWGAARAEAGADWQRALREQLQRVSAALQALRSALGSLSAVLRLPCEEESVGTLLALGRLLLLQPRLPRIRWSLGLWELQQEQIRGWIRQGRSSRERWRRLQTRWKRGLLGVGPGRLRARFAEHGDSSGPIAWAMLWGPKRSLERCCLLEELPLQAQLLADLEQAELLREEEADILLAGERGRALLGAHWEDLESDWDQLEQQLEHMESLRQLVTGLPGEGATLWESITAALTAEHPLSDPQSPTGRSLRQLLDRAAELKQRLQELEARLSWSPGTEALDDLGALQAQLSRWEASLAELPAWSRWLSWSAEAQSLGMSSLVQALAEGRLPPEQLPEALEVSALSWYRTEVVGMERGLLRFSPELHEARQRHYQELGQAQLEADRRRVVRALLERLPSPSAPGEMEVLRRAWRRQRGHAPIRQLLGQIPTVLKRLKPCLLMSPMSAAQYLDPAQSSFDLVLFDEASQIPPWEGIGAIARGRQVIVVGDPQQLPPTSFFQVQDSEESEDLESILDECAAMGFHQERLRGHYRSRHESLIAFSNRTWYQDSLSVLPSARTQSSGRGLGLRRVAGGCYDRGGRRSNLPEAEQLVEALLQELKRPRARSIGVVCFSAPQQELIQDLLEARRPQEPLLDEALLQEEGESLFVKNLENVQGDERDLILISVGYGPDARGRITMNFGPINRPGGYRRLNVAITRAREELLVFSSLRAEEIQPGPRAHQGVRQLRAFLEFLERGYQPRRAPEGEGEALLEPLALRLEEQGWRVTRSLEGAIDLALEHPRHPGGYLAGVQLDGARWASQRDHRDRERSHPQLLRQMGWRLIPAWTLSLGESPENGLRALKKTAEALALEDPASLQEVERTLPVREPQPSPLPSRERPDFLQRILRRDLSLPEGTPDWQLPPARHGGSRESLVQLSADSLIREDLAELMNSSAPLHREQALRWLLDQWGGHRLTSKMERRLEGIGSQAPALWRRRGDFLWAPDQDPQAWRGFRAPGSPRRRWTELPPEELRNLSLWILQISYSVPEEELLRCLSQLLGYRQLRPAMRQGLLAVLETMETQGLAQRDGNPPCWRPARLSDDGQVRSRGP